MNQTTLKLRLEMERLIRERAVSDLIAEGFALNVDNGGDEEELAQPSRNTTEVLSVMNATDEERLYVYRGDGKHTPGPRAIGWVLFVYGNDGYDVVSDYTMNLEEYLKGERELTERLENGDFTITVHESGPIKSAIVPSGE